METDMLEMIDEIVDDWQPELNDEEFPCEKCQEKPTIIFVAKNGDKTCFGCCLEYALCEPEEIN